MYRKYYKNDELFSSVIISFALFVVFGIIFYFIYYDTGGWTPSSYFYVSLCGLSLLSSIYYLIVYLVGLRKPILDYEVDIEAERINFSKRRYVSFKDIKLYARRDNRSEVKIFFKFRLLNIITFQLIDDQGNPMSEEISRQIGKYASPICHRQLYNYNFLGAFVFISFNFIFIFMRDSLQFIHQTYKYIIMFGVTIGLSLLLALINNLRLKYLYNKSLEEKTEEI